MGALNAVQQPLCIFEIILKLKVKKKTKELGERGEGTREKKQQRLRH